MKKYKILISLLVISLILTKCYLNRKTVSNNSTDNSVISTNPNNEETVIIKPTTDTIKSQISNENTNEQIKEINGFVLLSSMDKDFVIDLKYATTDNFTKKVIYPNSICVLRRNTAEKLVNANAQLKKLGYRIKVWDAYRPVYVQQIFWDIVKDSRFVANPKTGGSIHNKGCALDITLVDQNGTELNMPSKFDDFSSNAYRTNPKMTNEAKRNMDLLTKYMVDNGFSTITTEWWHFDDVDSKNYTIANINLELFLVQN